MFHNLKYYSGKFLVHNETNDDYPTSFQETNLIAVFKFSVDLNKSKIYLNNAILYQLLDILMIQKFVLEKVNDYFTKHEDEIKNRLDKIIVTDVSPKVKITFLNKYFYIKVYANKYSTIDSILKIISRTIKKEKNKADILMGE